MFQKIYFLPLFLFFFLCNIFSIQAGRLKTSDSTESIKINVQFAHHCTNPLECFSSLVKCDGGSGTGQLKLNLNISPIDEDYSNKTATPTTTRIRHALFPQENTVLQFNLQMDKSRPHYTVSETSTLDSSKRLFTHEITDSIFYRNYSTTQFSQFKAINEFYGTIELGLEGGGGGAFMRLIVQFTDCGRLFLFGFIRYKDILYQIRPTDKSLSQGGSHRRTEGYSRDTVEYYQKNVHQLSTVTRGLSNRLFTEELMISQRVNASQKDNCMTAIIVDNTFYQRLNNNHQLVAIYIALEFMLTNEIFSDSHRRERSFEPLDILSRIDIDLTVASELSHFTDDEMFQILLNTTQYQSGDHCIVHLFTGRVMMTSDFKVIFGWSSENTGATSLAQCGPDPWQVACLLTFPHELAHSWGAGHDEGELVRNEETYLMVERSKMDTPIYPSNLELSPKSREAIYEHINSLPRAKQAILGICGNGILEEATGEKCDEGPYRLCCNKQCQFNPGSVCSPFNSLCCNEDCQFKSSNESACVPWSYCADEELFCKRNGTEFCQKENLIKERVVDCEIGDKWWKRPEKEREWHETEKADQIGWIIIGLGTPVIILLAWIIVRKELKSRKVVTDDDEHKGPSRPIDEDALAELQKRNSILAADNSTLRILLKQIQEENERLLKEIEELKRPKSYIAHIRNVEEREPLLLAGHGSFSSSSRSKKS